MCIAAEHLPWPVPLQRLSPSSLQQQFRCIRDSLRGNGRQGTRGEQSCLPEAASDADVDVQLPTSCTSPMPDDAGAVPVSAFAAAAGIALEAQCSRSRSSPAAATGTSGSGSLFSLHASNEVEVKAALNQQESGAPTPLAHQASSLSEPIAVPAADCSMQAAGCAEGWLGSGSPAHRVGTTCAPFSPSRLSNCTRAGQRELPKGCCTGTGTAAMCPRSPPPLLMISRAGRHTDGGASTPRYAATASHCRSPARSPAAAGGVASAFVPMALRHGTPFADPSQFPTTEAEDDALMQRSSPDMQRRTSRSGAPAAPYAQEADDGATMHEASPCHGSSSSSRLGFSAACLSGERVATLRNCVRKGIPFTVLAAHHYQALVGAAARRDTACVLHLLNHTVTAYQGFGRRAKAAAAAAGPASKGAQPPASPNNYSPSVTAGAGHAHHAFPAPAAAAACEGMSRLLTMAEQGCVQLIVMPPAEHQRLCVAAQHGGDQLRDMLCPCAVRAPETGGCSPSWGAMRQRLLEEARQGRFRAADGQEPACDGLDTPALDSPGAPRMEALVQAAQQGNASRLLQLLAVRN